MVETICFRLKSLDRINFVTSLASRKILIHYETHTFIEN